jgi:hypothetical protein
MEQIANVLPVYKTLANGNTIIIIYDVFILFLFLFELFLYKNMDRYRKEVVVLEKGKIKPIRKTLVKLAESYEKHGFITVSSILLIISILVIVGHHKIILSEILAIAGSFTVFVIIVFFIQRIFIRLDQFQDNIVSRYIDLIYYLMLGHGFVIFSNFISTPDLPLGLVGLFFALLLCYKVMLRAIVNPKTISSTVSKKRKNRESASILKGMLALVFSEIGILFLMDYNCFKIHPGFFETSSKVAMDAFDLFYYLIVSFATIGYGDIYPIRFQGMIYSELIAIIIGLTSMFSTACFVGAVVAGATEISRQNHSDETDEKEENDVNSEKEKNPII